MAGLRRSGRGAKSQQESSNEETESMEPNSRRSARVNKFASSMKEPKNSIADLLNGTSGKLPAHDSRKRKARSQKGSPSSRRVSTESSELDSGSDSESESEDDIFEEEVTKPVRRSQRTRTTTNVMKSPAARHSSTRRRIKTQIQPSSESEEESSEESQVSSESEESDSEDDIKIQRVIASKIESRKSWRNMLHGKNTSEIDNGSRWFQDEDAEEDLKLEERFFVKWADLSFLHSSWESKEDLIDQVEGAKHYLTTFFRKNRNGFIFDADERMDGEYFDPAFVQVDRILEVVLPERRRRKLNDFGMIFDRDDPDYETGTGRQFLIKWKSTSYSEATYEFERDLITNEVEYLEHVESFLNRNRKPAKGVMNKAFSSQEDARRRLYKIFGDQVPDGEAKEKAIEDYKENLEGRIFKNGGQLRDYQAEGVSWLLANHINKRSAILADEMGLGKTIQTAVYVDMLSTALHSQGPFLIVAPLSTIPHWQREFTGWTDFNTIVYHGSARERELIRELEFAFECDRPEEIGMNQRYLKKCHRRTAPKWMRTWMTQVVITTPEMLVTKDFSELADVRWDLLVVDEAHRLKNHTSKLALNLRDDNFQFNHTLLLTGTPIQNNMNELWTLMNFIDPKAFDDCDNFMDQYGNMKSKDKVDVLHNVIRPYILRRLKEDVEKSVPPKEETLIEIELTTIQKQYYRALYEKNIHFLHKKVKKPLDGPSINNLSMQLRKCCNHPYLLRGVEEIHTSREAEADALVKSSGKLILLDKLLPKLKAGGHRVLIFSQFKIMLDIIEDYLALRTFKFERIDGSITGKKRQMAIDRFQTIENMDSSFIMLLSTRAGGVGINLTAADTCIIFDSDWNPQNDLQAQARCHRIGQTKNVKVYRLLTRKTYEMQMFHMSSLKMGLDQAVLQGIENGGSLSGNETLSKEEVEKLLRHGAYDIFREEKDGVSEKESNEFIEQDIDTILERRSKRVIHDNTGSKSNAAGGSFSKASFKTTKKDVDGSGETNDVDVDDPDFWKKMVGDAKFDDDTSEVSTKKRSRKKAKYSETYFDRDLDKLTILQNDDDSEDDQYSDNDVTSSDEDDEHEDREFNFSSKIMIQNEVLQKMMEKKKQIHQSRKQRNRWGGKSLFEWRKEDVEELIKLLHRFGYGNVKWDLFIDCFLRVASKEYDHDEVKRMCWALVLVTLQEAIEDDVNEQGKRLRRTAMKNDDDVTAVTLEIESAEWRARQLSSSFDRIWSMHGNWASKAFLQGVEYAESSSPRDVMMINKRTKQTKLDENPLLNLFTKNIWPALESRGWSQSKDVDNKGKSYLYKNGVMRVKSAAEVLDKTPELHPELTVTVKKVISDAAVEMGLDTSSLTDNPKGAIEDNVSGVTDIDNRSETCTKKLSLLDKSEESIRKMSELNISALSTFIKQHGPLQLIIDRTKARRQIALHPRLLQVLTYLRNAHTLLARSNTPPRPTSDHEKYSTIANLIDVSSKCALPHPQWKPEHDAILIVAITKHGWIDKDSRGRRIIEDSSIIWGPPFDEGILPEASSRNPIDQKPKADLSDVKDTAARVLKFLNSDEIKMKDLKGFNLALVLKSYGIIKMVSEDASSHDEPKEKWCLDNHFLSQTDSKSQSVESESGLPARKELLKRAKAILTRVSEKSKTPQSETKTITSQQHLFTVLDQSNILNVFLGEILRSLLKVKTIKLVNFLISCALEEIDFRQKFVLSVDQPNRDEETELNQISEHIRLVEGASLSRKSKNIVRVIMGIDPIPKAGEELFLSQQSKDILSSSPSKKSSQKLKLKDKASGDAAINRALLLATKKQKEKDSQGKLEETGTGILKFSLRETLLLKAMCSMGIPTYIDEDADLALNEVGENINLSWRKIANFVNEEVQGLVESDMQNSMMTLAKNAIEVLSLVQHNCGQDKKSKNGKKENDGLGTQIFIWSRKLLRKWVKTYKITNMDCSPVDNKDVVAMFDKKACRAIFIQVSQQTRLRSLYLKYGTAQIANLTLRAVKRSDWTAKPSWWEESHYAILLKHILGHGYGKFEQVNKTFGGDSNNENEEETYKAVTPGASQNLTNQLTRELHNLDDHEESMKMLKKRKINRAVGKRAESRKSTKNDQSIKKVKKTVSSSNTVRQVNIQAFFKPSAQGSNQKTKKSRISSEVGRGQSSQQNSKRKGIHIPNDVTPEKKNKTSPL